MPGSPIDPPTPKRMVARTKSWTVSRPRRRRLLHPPGCDRDTRTKTQAPLGFAREAPADTEGARHYPYGPPPAAESEQVREEPLYEFKGGSLRSPPLRLRAAAGGRPRRRPAPATRHPAPFCCAAVSRSDLPSPAQTIAHHGIASRASPNRSTGQPSSRAYSRRCGSSSRRYLTGSQRRSTSPPSSPSNTPCGSAPAETLQEKPSSTSAPSLRAMPHRPPAPTLTS